MTTIDTAAIRERAEDATPGPWRCFHCHAVFTEWQAAMHHFGVYANAMAACLFTGEEQILRTLRAEEHSAQEMFRQKTEYEHEISHLRAELAAKDALIEEAKTIIEQASLAITKRGEQVDAEWRDYDRVAERADRVVMAWRQTARTFLAKLKEQE